VYLAVAFKTEGHGPGAALAPRYYVMLMFCWFTTLETRFHTIDLTFRT
jgi:hypothetical protein